MNDAEPTDVLTMKELVGRMTDKQKVRFLQRLRQLGITYHPKDGGMTLDDTDRFTDALLGRPAGGAKSGANT